VASRAETSTRDPSSDTEIKKAAKKFLPEKFPERGNMLMLSDIDSRLLALQG